MGNSNSAITSCVQVPGHAQFCVQVLLADGKLVQFSQPVLAIQVMQDHPGHLVVKFSAWESSPRSHGRAASSWTMNSSVFQIAGRMTSLKKTKRSKNSANMAMLQADERLEIGSTYYLLPVAEEEEERKNLSFKSFKNSSRVGSSFEYESQNDSPSPEKKLKSLWPSRSMPARPEVEQQRRQPPVLSLVEEIRVMKSNSLGKLLMEGTGREHCLLSLYQPSGTGERRRSGRSRRQRRLSQIAWIPVLDSIPESSDECFDEAQSSPLYVKRCDYRTTPAGLQRLQSCQ